MVVLKEVVKLVMDLGMFRWCVCVFIFSGIDVVLEWLVKVNVSIGYILWKYFSGFMLLMFSRMLCIVNIISRLR